MLEIRAHRADPSPVVRSPRDRQVVRGGVVTELRSTITPQLSADDILHRHAFPTSAQLRHFSKSSERPNACPRFSSTAVPVDAKWRKKSATSLEVLHGADIAK